HQVGKRRPYFLLKGRCDIMDAANSRYRALPFATVIPFLVWITCLSMPTSADEGVAPLGTNVCAAFQDIVDKYDAELRHVTLISESGPALRERAKLGLAAMERRDASLRGLLDEELRRDVRRVSFDEAMALARAAELIADWSRAVRYAQSAIEQKPASMDAQILLARSLVNSGKLDDANRYIHEHTAKDPSDRRFGHLYYALCSRYRIAGDTQLASKCLDDYVQYLCAEIGDSPSAHQSVSFFLDEQLTLQNEAPMDLKEFQARRQRYLEILDPQREWHIDGVLLDSRSAESIIRRSVVRYARVEVGRRLSDAQCEKELSLWMRELFQERSVWKNNPSLFQHVIALIDRINALNFAVRDDTHFDRLLAEIERAVDEQGILTNANCSESAMLAESMEIAHNTAETRRWLGRLVGQRWAPWTENIVVYGTNTTGPLPRVWHLTTIDWLTNTPTFQRRPGNPDFPALVIVVSGTVGSSNGSGRNENDRPTTGEVPSAAETIASRLGASWRFAVAPEQSSLADIFAHVKVPVTLCLDERDTVARLIVGASTEVGDYIRARF
ncbi:MAG: hypothetical protein KDA63_05720, partial [Planctomycetales bacterium]|nr:hypothetical protein [Planctomycetales bacterium]